jgi:DNA-binding GntR family transcriptional regulator
LPGITALAAEYGVSRSTVDRAVKVLRSEGRVTITPGWGTFAAEG